MLIAFVDRSGRNSMLLVLTYALTYLASLREGEIRISFTIRATRSAGN